MNMKKLQNAKWKPVQLPDDVACNGLEGFAILEELTDYSLLKENKWIHCKGKDQKHDKSSDTTPVSKKGKNKPGESKTEEPDDLQSGRNKLDEQKKKKRKRKKKNLGKNHEVIAADTNVQSSITDENIKTNEIRKRKTEGSDNPLAKRRKLDVKKKKKKKKKSNNSIETREVKTSEPVNLSKLLDSVRAWYSLGICEPILRALAEQGFREPTEIQAKTIPASLMGRRDILGAAETGSGKTLAFGIPILHHIFLDKERNAADSNSGEDGNNVADTTSEDDDEGNEEIEDQNDNGTRNEDDEEGNDENFDEENDRNSEDDDENIHDQQNQELENEEMTGDSEDSDNDEDNSTQGIGCVKVTDNIQVDIPPTKHKPTRPLYALILTPTRELAIQIHNHLKAAAKYTGIKIAVVVGGMSVQKQERMLQYGPEIVVATPGRLWEMIQDNNRHLSQVNNVRFLVVDETDRMLEKGHFQELQNLMELLNTSVGEKKRRQNFVFSATLTLVHQLPRYLKGKKKKLTPEQKLKSIIDTLGIANPKVVDITNDTGIAEKITESRILCMQDEKDFYLYYFLQRHPGRTLVFCNSISCVRRLSQLFTLLKCQPFPLHASMQQRQRLKNLDRFRNNPYGLLLATDVAARGLDIPDVQHVVHYQMPRTSESYIHRSGRTARAKKEGLTLLLIGPEESYYYTQVCQTLGRKKDLPLFPISVTALDAVKKRVMIARELDHLKLITRRSTTETSWYQKALKSMDMVADDDDVPKQLDDEDASRYNRQAALQQKQLDVLLSKPLFLPSLTESSLDVLKTEMKSPIVRSRKKQKNKRMRRREKNKNKE